MLSSLSLLLSLSTVIPFAFAAPVPLFGLHFGSGSVAEGTPTAVSQSTVDSSLLRPAQFARVAYCSPASVTALSCGAPCDAINKVKVLTAGGDEGATPRCELGIISFADVSLISGYSLLIDFVATDPDSQTVVVAHQGTDPEKLLSIANDAEFKQVVMNSTLFPSAASTLERVAYLVDTS